MVSMIHYEVIKPLDEMVPKLLSTTHCQELNTNSGIALYYREQFFTVVFCFNITAGKQKNTKPK